MEGRERLMDAIRRRKRDAGKWGGNAPVAVVVALVMRERQMDARRRGRRPCVQREVAAVVRRGSVLATEAFVS